MEHHGRKQYIQILGTLNIYKEKIEFKINKDYHKIQWAVEFHNL